MTGLRTDHVYDVGQWEALKKINLNKDWHGDFQTTLDQSRQGGENKKKRMFAVFGKYSS